MEYAKKTLSTKSLHLLNELIDSVRDKDTMISGSSSQLKGIWEEEARFGTIADVMHAEAARLRTKVNQLVSTSVALPTEILAYIFELGAREDIEHRLHVPAFSRTVSHVCRYWRKISIGFPALWTLFHPLLPPEVTSRAKGSLLDFVILPRYIWVTHGPSDLPAFGEQLVRARSLRLTFSKALYAGDLELMSFPAPHLTSLLIDSTMDWIDYNNLPERPFSGHHPRLTEVSIRNFSMGWSIPILSNLLTL
ncbi:hypothetical protein BOTBODRAFT_176101 [Botryobasidium botryosum FD-172 SS1]|uniref:Uncharacterized protein n=1 Tax=Botryobasidium botryosum (strain FD-172 SS1) TaxID=930990 RepID=A0A067MM69_BOTB1|nr:hypothetical protein BOTBODRAFT_176101 [Botryobasidium botryosum FD-172 SS1]